MSAVAPEPRLVEQWPINSKIILVDAWFRNPIQVKIVQHANVDHVVGEDARGVIHYAHHKRIRGFADRFTEFDTLF